MPNFSKPNKYIKMITNMREGKSDEYRSKKAKTIQAFINVRPIFPLAEALGEISLPLSLGIVGTDRSRGNNVGAGRDLRVVGG